MPPERLHVVTSDDPAVAEAVGAFCAERDIELSITATTSPGILKDEETVFVERQFSEVTSEFALVVRLDTFPYRSGHADWLSEAQEAMRRTGAFFVTGSCRVFRKDIR